MGSSAQYFLPVFEINFCTSSSLRGARFSSRHRFDGPVDGLVGGLDGLIDGLVDGLIDNIIYVNIYYICLYSSDKKYISDVTISRILKT